MTLMRTFAAAALLALAAACTPNTAEEKSAERAKIDAEAAAALDELYNQNQAARTLSRNADGILVFPSVVKGGLVVGAETGDGVLLVGGDPVAYYNTSAVSVGFQAGAQAYSQVLMFMTADALSRFRNSAGFEIGVDGEVTVIDAGVNAEVDSSNLQTDIVAFLFGSEGLMGGVSIEGSKFTPKDL